MNLDLMMIRLRKLAAITVRSFYRDAFFRVGVVPAIEHEAVLGGLDFDFVADVGANRGQFSLVCRRMKPRARIAAFEPLPAPAAIYRALFGADPRVRLHECALAPQRGEMTMHVSGRDDSSSLLPISALQSEHFPGTAAVGCANVPVGPMPDFISRDDLGRQNLLKIDVQGFELEVLKSAEPMLSQFRWIYAECSSVPLYEGQALADEVIRWLKARGFDLIGRFNPSRGRDGTLLQADLLFQLRDAA
jgi:FkbM family methyltransferase